MKTIITYLDGSHIQNPKYNGKSVSKPLCDINLGNGREIKRVSENEKSDCNICDLISKNKFCENCRVEMAKVQEYHICPLCDNSNQV